MDKSLPKFKISILWQSLMLRFFWLILKCWTDSSVQYSWIILMKNNQQQQCWVAVFCFLLPLVVINLMWLPDQQCWLHGEAEGASGGRAGEELCHKHSGWDGKTPLFVTPTQVPGEDKLFSCWPRKWHDLHFYTFSLFVHLDILVWNLWLGCSFSCLLREMLTSKLI